MAAMTIGHPCHRRTRGRRSPPGQMRPMATGRSGELPWAGRRIRRCRWPRRQPSALHRRQQPGQDVHHHPEAEREGQGKPRARRRGPAGVDRAAGDPTDDPVTAAALEPRSGCSGHRPMAGVDLPWPSSSHTVTSVTMGDNPRRWLLRVGWGTSPMVSRSQGLITMHLGARGPTGRPARPPPPIRRSRSRKRCKQPRRCWQSLLSFASSLSKLMVLEDRALFSTSSAGCSRSRRARPGTSVAERFFTALPCPGAGSSWCARSSPCSWPRRPSPRAWSRSAARSASISDRTSASSWARCCVALGASILGTGRWRGVHGVWRGGRGPVHPCWDGCGTRARRRPPDAASPITAGLVCRRGSAHRHRRPCRRAEPDGFSRRPRPVLRTGRDPGRPAAGQHVVGPSAVADPRRPAGPPIRLDSQPSSTARSRSGWHVPLQLSVQ